MAAAAAAVVLVVVVVVEARRRELACAGNRCWVGCLRGVCCCGCMRSAMEVFGLVADRGALGRRHVWAWVVAEEVRRLISRIEAVDGGSSSRVVSWWSRVGRCARLSIGQVPCTDPPAL
ncbi:hypothetical protein BDY21DRAFT_331752 [Lineolata rhizophorae]|uniref:Secreted protein n=1 Tax=Lineolata rhizophorae TaxID=578093 RepID=A0A6A6PBY4_9PEZI|nr:hypothetical protein BDY21DRAFT_331752 [Lineolata rhizophorae]